MTKFFDLGGFGGQTSARQREMAALLAEQPSNASPLAGLVKGLSTGYLNAKANRTEAEETRARQKSMVDLLNTSDPQQRAIKLAESQDPTLQQLGLKALLQNTTQKPYSSVGKIQADLAAGLIDPQTAQAALAKATTVSPLFGGGLTPYQQQQIDLQNRRLEFQQDNINRINKKEETRLKQLKVPGYDLSPDYEPTVKEAQDLRKITSARETITRETMNLQKLVKDHGRNIAIDPELRSKSNQILQKITLNQKELENLGALAGPDQEILQKLLPDPVSATGLWMGGDDVANQYNDFIQYVNNRANDAAGQRGYIPNNRLIIGQQPTQPQPQNGTIDATVQQPVQRGSLLPQRQQGQPIAEMVAESVPTGGSVNPSPSIPAAAIQFLKQNPNQAQAFEQKYGVPAAQYLQ